MIKVHHATRIQGKKQPNYFIYNKTKGGGSAFNI